MICTPLGRATAVCVFVHRTYKPWWCAVVMSSFQDANERALWCNGLHSVDDWGVPQADQELALPAAFASEEHGLNLNIWTPANTYQLQMETEGRCALAAA